MTMYCFKEKFQCRKFVQVGSKTELYKLKVKLLK